MSRVLNNPIATPFYHARKGGEPIVAIPAMKINSVAASAGVPTANGVLSVKWKFVDEWAIDWSSDVQLYFTGCASVADGGDEFAYDIVCRRTVRRTTVCFVTLLVPGGRVVRKKGRASVMGVRLRLYKSLQQRAAEFAP